MKLLRELKKLPPGSITPDILNDYGKMRGHLPGTMKAP
jgi:hypothetical protein